MNKKAICSMVVICFLTLSINQCFANDLKLEEESVCYGFIVSQVKCENIIFEDQINCKIRNMINDLLREQIPVYWTTTNVTVSIRYIDDEIEQDILFDKGTFIIPFTGYNFQDTKITSIVFDYNQSSEIEENNTTKIPIYLLEEPLLKTQVYLLSEVKLAQYSSLITVGEICYLEISRKCGFLTFDILNEKEVKNKLNNAIFNVITRVGENDEAEYASFLKSKSYRILEDVKYDTSNKIRIFVYNGGGYIGSCGGAEKACAGMMFGSIPIYFKRRVYNPKLPSYGSYAIADVIYIPGNKAVGSIPVEIVNDTHPVTFGLNRIVWDLHLGGPKFNYVGGYAHIIGKFSGENHMSGMPSWLSSSFGSGRIVLFSSHPEIAGYYNNNDSKDGKTIISNALYYTTSKGKEELNTSQSRNLSFIINIWDKTENLKLGEPENIFDEIKSNISENINEILNLSDYVLKLKILIEKIAEKKCINFSKDPEFLGHPSVSVSRKPYLVLFIDYLKNTTKTLKIIEEIYPLLKNDTDFLQRLEVLKTDLSMRINETKNICKNSQDICKDLEKFLQNYFKSRWRSIPSELLIRDKAHKLYQQVFSGFHFVPQSFFNSLKLLRISWYDYEVNCAI